MGKRILKDMFLQGTIETVYDFPKMEDRREGFVWEFKNDADIADLESAITREVGTAVSSTEGDKFSTGTGHCDPDSDDYGLITGSEDLWSADNVGQILSINISSVWTDRIISEYIDTNSIRVLTCFDSNLVDVDAVTEAKVAGAFTVSTSDTHTVEINPAYGVIVGTGTYFTKTLNVGDVIVTPGEQYRNVIEITDDTHLKIDVLFNGSNLSGSDFYVLNKYDILEELTGTIASTNDSVYFNSDYCKLTFSEAHNMKTGDAVSILEDGIIKMRNVGELDEGDDSILYITEPFRTELTTNTCIRYTRPAFETSVSNNKFYVWVDGEFEIV